jgi:hypothetical protein
MGFKIKAKELVEMKRFKIIGIVVAVFAVILGVGLKVCSSCIKDNQIAIENGFVAENEETEITNDAEMTDITNESVDEMIVETEENTGNENIEIAQNTEKSSQSENKISSSQSITSIQESKSNNINKTQNISNNATNNNKNTERQSQEIQIIEQNNQTITNSSNSSSNSNNEKEMIVEESASKEETSNAKKEEYIKNDEMINRIKQVIQNNESEFMQKYGYEVTVDSSIKAHTNQFTFTENRVKAYLPYKFGTIRIYAEDYYVNGQLVMTECYIL